MYKSFKTISLNITEEQYRNDGAMHYSALSGYERGGFASIPTLFDEKKSPSLTFGSAVDSILTGGQKEFDERFIVAEFPALEPAIMDITKAIFDIYCISYDHLDSVPDKYIIAMTETMSFHKNWKPETRAKVIKEKGAQYYDLLQISNDKTVLSTDVYNKVIASVSALKTSEATKRYFESDDPFDDSIERLYQLKFSGVLNFDDKHLYTLGEGYNAEEIDKEGLRFSCMADLIIVDHKNKVVYPCDLKTSGHKEYDFYKSFIDWGYNIQARLYWRLIRAAMDNDPVFRDYNLEKYTFIVVNGETLTPMTWLFEDTKFEGTLYYGKDRQIELRDPFDLGLELNLYLKTKATFPIGISAVEKNSLREWLNKL